MTNILKMEINTNLEIGKDIWFCVATSGKTIDGRDIQKEWLESAAKNYSKELYQAMIWDEHASTVEREWQGNLGTVEEIKLEETDGNFKLFARLQPSQFLIQLNQGGQKIFTSVELAPNFPNESDYYLTGLAVTDQPASTGLSRLQFSNSNKKSAIYLTSQQLNQGSDMDLETVKTELEKALEQNKAMQEKIATLEQLLKNGDEAQAETVVDELDNLADDTAKAIESAQEEAEASLKEEFSAVKKMVETLIKSNEETQKQFTALLTTSTTKKPGLGLSTPDSIELH